MPYHQLSSYLASESKVLPYLFNNTHRTKAGLTAARAQGRQGGRPKGLSEQALSKAQATQTLYLQQDKTVAEIGKLLSVGLATIYR